MPNLFEYLNYREYLKANFAELQQKNPHFSFRSFNRKAGIKSPGFMKALIAEKRNLTEASLAKVVQGLGLQSSERRYFENLVRFNQAKDPETQEYYFQTIASNKKFVKAKPLRSAQYKLFSHWYYVAILELLRVKAKGRKDPLWIQRNLCEEVGIREIKKAVKDLITLGLVKLDAKGNLTRQDIMVTTPDEVESVLLAEFYREMHQLAQRATQKDNTDQKELSSLTIAVSPEDFKKVRKEIQSFRRRLHGLLEESQSPRTQVAHLMIQWFPVSK